MDPYIQKLFQEDATEPSSSNYAPKSQMNGIFGRSPENQSNVSNSNSSPSTSRPAYGALKSMLKDIQDRKQMLQEQNSKNVSTRSIPSQTPPTSLMNNLFDEDEPISEDTKERNPNTSSVKSFFGSNSPKNGYSETPDSQTNSQILGANSFTAFNSARNSISSKTNPNPISQAPIDMFDSDEESEFSWQSQPTRIYHPQETPKESPFQSRKENPVIQNSFTKQNVFPEEVPNRYQKSLFKTSIDPTNFHSQPNTPRKENPLQQVPNQNLDFNRTSNTIINSNPYRTETPTHQQPSSASFQPNFPTNKPQDFKYNSYQTQDMTPPPTAQNNQSFPPPPKMPPTNRPVYDITTAHATTTNPASPQNYSNGRSFPSNTSPAPQFGANPNLGGNITTNPLVNPKSVHYFGAKVTQARTQLESNLMQNPRMNMHSSPPPPPKMPPTLPNQTHNTNRSKSQITNNIPISLPSNDTKPQLGIINENDSPQNPNLFQISWYCTQPKSIKDNPVQNTSENTPSPQNVPSIPSALEIQSRLIERLQWIQAKDEFRSMLLMQLIDGKSHSERELYQIAKKTRKQIGTVTFGLIMYSLIEQLGADQLIREEKDENRIYHLSADLKAACEFAFQDS